MHTIYPLFSAPVYASKIDPLFTNNIDYITNSKFKRTPNDDSYTSVEKYILNSPELKELRSQVDSHIYTYLYDVIKTKKNIKFKLLNSWIMQHLPKDYGIAHSHGNSLFSGVVYIKTSKNCGNIKFHGRYNNLFSETVALNYEEYSLYNSASWYFEPNDGLILLFPSYLVHEILPNLSNNPRYCVAFNIFIEGEVGAHGEIDALCVK
jgi:uncharacterized protein (TIGR02466 family)